MQERIRQTNILIVEVDPVVRNFISEKIKEMLPESVVFPTECAEMALSMLQVFSPDIITVCYVTDPVNQKENGLTLAKKIRHQFNYTKKIIMISGYGDFINKGEPGAECVDFFLGKPINSLEFRESLTA